MSRQVRDVRDLRKTVLSVCTATGVIGDSSCIGLSRLFCVPSLQSVLCVRHRDCEVVLPGVTHARRSWLQLCCTVAAAVTELFHYKWLMGPDAAVLDANMPARRTLHTNCS